MTHVSVSEATEMPEVVQQRNRALINPNWSLDCRMCSLSSTTPVQQRQSTICPPPKPSITHAPCYIFFSLTFLLLLLLLFLLIYSSYYFFFFLHRLLFHHTRYYCIIIIILSGREKQYAIRFMLYSVRVKYSLTPGGMIQVRCIYDNSICLISTYVHAECRPSALPAFCYQTRTYRYAHTYTSSIRTYKHTRK